MPIVAGDIDFYLSGGAANTDPNAALGGARSTTTAVSATTNSFFDIVSSGEASSGDTEYRGFYVYNAHGSLTLQNAIIYISGNTTNAENAIAIALADEAVNVAMETIANESTAPVGPTFSAPTSEGAALNIGDIPAGQFKGIWVRRTVNAASSAASGQGVTFTVKGDTAA